MANFKLLLVLIASITLSSCGFHTPYTNTSLNAKVISAGNNAFADALSKHLNADAPKRLQIELGAEVQQKHTSSYTSAGQANNYTLTLSIPVRVSNQNTLLLSETLSASQYVSKMSLEQADRLQTQEAYQQLRQRLVKQLLRKLAKLNEG